MIQSLGFLPFPVNLLHFSLHMKELVSHFQVSLHLYLFKKQLDIMGSRFVRPSQPDNWTKLLFRRSLVVPDLKPEMTPDAFSV